MRESGGGPAGCWQRLRSLWYWNKGNTDELVARHPMFKGAELDPPWPDIVRLAKLLEGRPRNLSVHCGGVVVVPGRAGRNLW